MRVLLAIVATVLLAAPAQAAPVQVTWPQARTYGPGERIAVTVKSDRKVKVSVLRVSASGTVMGSVVRRTLKRGTVTATLARPGTYAVRVDRRQRTLKVVAAPAPAPHECPPATTASADVRLAADRARPGETLRYTLVNTSDGCLTTGAGYGLEHRLTDGAWKPVPWPLIFPLYAVILPPGATFDKQIGLPADAPLGTYRILEEYAGFTEPTFEVVA